MSSTGQEGPGRNSRQWAEETEISGVSLSWGIKFGVQFPSKRLSRGKLTRLSTGILRELHSLYKAKRNRPDLSQAWNSSVLLYLPSRS